MKLGRKRGSMDQDNGVLGGRWIATIFDFHCGGSGYQPGQIDHSTLQASLENCLVFLGQRLQFVGWCSSSNDQGFLATTGRQQERGILGEEFQWHQAGREILHLESAAVAHQTQDPHRHAIDLGA